MKINGIQGDAVKTMRRKNGFLYEKERIILIERTDYSTRKNGFFSWEKPFSLS